MRGQKLVDERYQRGLCVSCGTRKPRPGLRTCQTCADNQRQWREGKRAQGLCTHCGVESALPNRSLCQVCIEKLHRYAVEHRNEMREQKRDRKRELKLQAITLFGGQCADCGKKFPRRPKVFDFDHRDPLRKTATPATLLRHSLKKFLIEAENLDLVCANCHRTRTVRRAAEREF